LAAAAAYDEYQGLLSTGGHAAVRDFCDEIGMSASAIDGVTQLRNRFLQQLIEVGFAQADTADGGTAANSQQEQLEMVRCMLCAGLFPNVVQVQRLHGGQGKVTLVSAEREKCVVHPMSLNVRQQDNFASDQGWLLFHKKVQTSQIFLHDSTLVGPIPLILFGGEFQVDVEKSKSAKSRTRIAIGRLRFKTKTDATTALLRALRKELDRLLLLKVADPLTDLNAHAGILLESLTKLLQLEDRHANGVRLHDY